MDGVKVSVGPIVGVLAEEALAPFAFILFLPLEAALSAASFFAVLFVGTTGVGGQLKHLGHLNRVLWTMLLWESLEQLEQDLGLALLC